jgi:hypothetical protein
MIIVLIRNPVERAYSHYHHEVNMGFETLTFEEAIDKEGERLDGEREKLIREETYRSFNFQNFSYISRGIYLDQLKDWRSFFNKDQMLVLRSEDFYHNPSKTLAQVTEYLGLKSWDLKEYKKYHQSNYQPMDPTIRTRLSEYYRPFNQCLYDYLDKDLSWDN